MEELTEEQRELVAAARKARAAEIADDAVAYLDYAARPTIGSGPTGEIIMDILKSLILNACGCICTPGRRTGGPAIHAEDILCPVHGSGEYASSPLPCKPLMERVWRSRHLQSGGTVEFSSLAALDEFISTDNPGEMWWVSSPPDHAMETAWRVTVNGVAIMSPWTLIRTTRPDRV